jgi:hypothetical protein
MSARTVSQSTTLQFRCVGDTRLIESALSSLRWKKSEWPEVLLGQQVSA